MADYPSELGPSMGKAMEQELAAEIMLELRKYVGCRLTKKLMVEIKRRCARRIQAYKRDVLDQEVR